jgi:hypothetical protein
VPSDKTWHLALHTPSITAGQPLILSIADLEIAGFRHAQCSIARVEDDEDAWVLTCNSAISHEQNGAKVSVPTQEFGIPGLYRISSVVLMPSDAADPREAGSETATPRDLLFEVVGTGEKPRSAEELLAHYRDVGQRRQADFLSGIGDKTGGSLEFEALVFVKNCLLRTRMRIGPCQLIPFGGLGCQDEVTLMNEFLAKNGAPPIADPQEALGLGPFGEPSVVVHFPRVLAASTERAGQIVQDEVALLCDVLGLHRQSYGSPFGGILVRRDSGERFRWIHTPPYRGNVAAGFLAGEVPRLIRTDIDKARGDPRLALYLSLLREAIREERIEFAYFRFWNLLETIARSKGFDRKPRLDWSGSQMTSPKGKPLVIESQAEQLVFELLRSTLAPQSVSGRAFGTSFEELVPIWYRHRNCVVHGGGCFPEDASFCLRTDQKFVQCRRAHEEVVAKHGGRDQVTDTCFQALRQTAVLLLQTECR